MRLNLFYFEEKMYLCAKLAKTLKLTHDLRKKNEFFVVWSERTCSYTCRGISQTGGKQKCRQSSECTSYSD
jgi:hypothetical protein